MNLTRTGFGAIEVLVATVILGLALTPILSLFPSSSRQALQSQGHVQAQALAEQVLNDWVAKAIAGTYENQATESVSAVTATTASESCPELRLELEALEVPGKLGLWRISARVEWDGPTGSSRGPRSIVLERLFCKPGLALEADYPLSAPRPEAERPQA